MSQMNKTFQFACRIACIVASTCVVASTASALPIVFTGSGTNGSSGTALAASVTFDVSGNALIVTLQNTSHAPVQVPSDVLTAVFFNISGSPSLSRTSAVLGAGSTVTAGGTTGPGVGVVGGEWAYAGGLSGAPNGATIGLSSIGTGLFGPGDRFPGDNLDGPDSPDGLQYGLLPAAGLTANPNPTLPGQKLIQDTIIFTLGGLPSGFNLSGISNVSFQYGTDHTVDPNIIGGGPSGPETPPVPEPASLTLLASGMAALAGWRLKRGSSSSI